MLKPPARIGAIERAHATLVLPYAEIARILLTGESTLYRWRAGTSAPTGVNRARLIALDEFVSALRRGFPDAAAARRWLETPFAPLGRRSPRALLSEGRVEMLVGALAVLAALAPASVGSPVDEVPTDGGVVLPPTALVPTAVVAGARPGVAWRAVPDGVRG